MVSNLSALAEREQGGEVTEEGGKERGSEGTIKIITLLCIAGSNLKWYNFCGKQYGSSSKV